MKVSYYPGCTLKTKAKNLEDSTLASLKALGVEVAEMPRWNCCGAVFSLADDDLIHHVAPVRNLIRAMEQGSDSIVTVCSQCYNTLARANLLMKENPEKRDTLNAFMSEEPDYAGEVEVKHLLTFLHDEIGWEGLKEKITVPLTELKIAPFYGCSTIRPKEVSINAPDTLMLEDFLVALGATPIDFSASQECCGSYQVLANPEIEEVRAVNVLNRANQAGADALVTSCPMCDYNLGKRQKHILPKHEELTAIPTYYFSQLLAVALGLDPEVCRFELNNENVVKLLEEKKFIAAS